MGNNASAHLQISVHTPASSSVVAGVVLLKVDKDKYECEELRLQVRGSEITSVDYTESRDGPDNKSETVTRTAHGQYDFLKRLRLQR